MNDTAYSLNNQSWTKYTGPFNVTSSGNTTVYYRSIDQAGNVEATRSTAVNASAISLFVVLLPAVN